MVGSESTAELAYARPAVRRIAISLLLGAVVGIIAYYVIAVVATVQIPGSFTVHPVTLALVALVGASVVAVAWRWPLAGLAAGVAIVLIVVVVLADRIGWTASGSNWLDPFNAVGFGGASGYPALVGAVMVTVSALRLRSRSA